jgi:hypothetical protein
MQRLISFGLLLVLVLMPAAVLARPAAQHIPNVKPIIVTYDVYVGGVHFLTGDVLFQEQKDKYHSIVKAHTYGFWYKMLPWDTMLDASGKIAGDHFVPVEFHTRDEFKHKPKTTRLVFDGKGNVDAEFNPPSNDGDKWEAVTPDQKRGALDPITGLLQMLASSAMTKSCAVTVPIFDGKRRFDITATDAGMDSLDEEGYSVFKGQAHICDATFNMVAGAWKEGEKNGFWKLNDKDAGREPFHIWLANLSPDLPEMPVRLESGSVWGLIIMHLSQWRYAGPDDLK